MNTAFKGKLLIGLIVLSLIPGRDGFVSAQANGHIPFIQDKGSFSRLMVDGKPWIMLAGELHNSTSSDLNYLEPVWDKMNALNLNTVIATVSWELFEPREGQFDYTLVDGIIKGAREHNLRLVLIWFGSWKNSWSTYAPEWVKNNPKRFPRMQIKTGENTGALSAFGENTMEADACAFAALMKHIRAVDENEQTVLMMQVENETGVLNTSRDMSVLAEKHFKQQVPLALMSYLKKNSDHIRPEMKSILDLSGKTAGTWSEVFGSYADEAFQAWYIASYVEKVVSAGKSVYSLPMYVNAWLDPDFSTVVRPNYPSGGPVARVMDIWRAAAPSVYLYAPDIYLDDFKKVCSLYGQPGNPLFIPEAHRDIRAAANVYYALGQHMALGFSPFGIDGIDDIRSLSTVYSSLSGILPFLASHQNADNSAGLLYTGNDTETIELNGYKLRIHYNQKRSIADGRPEAAGLILSTDNGEYYIAGFGFSIDFETISGIGWVETLMQEEGSFENGEWIAGRRLNGDELQVSLPERPSFRKIRVHIIE